ncbi:capsule assembly Wzi family protein [Pedobacter sp. GR22-6]|uniref:capsule assembly Wzi family protein n=1 Tax=Pedobacter sp. GR22-6 TaxID=3127957 RepID=UPI00307EBA24
MITTAFFSTVNAQLKDEYKSSIELHAIGTSNSTVPFWMRSNQFGSTPLCGISSSVIGKFSKKYSELTPNEEIYGKNKLVDWGFGFEGRVNGGKSSNLQLIETYVKAKASIFQLKAGRTKDVVGLNGDTSLSSGNFAVSGNALGIPKIELSIPEYWRAPIFDGLFSIKGSFAHGWVGPARILDSIDLSSKEKRNVYYTIDNTPNTYFHQKSFYGRIGREGWKLNIYGGFNHQVYWGNEDSAYGSRFKLSPAQTFLYVATGRAYGSDGIPRSKIGNQIGSIDLGIDYDFESLKVMIYRQQFYDVGALAKLANIADGLTGLSIENKRFRESNQVFQLKKILIEFFSSKNQAGYPWSTPTASGDEDYYNNYYYIQGWTYKNIGLGNPLITRKDDAKPGQASSEYDYFINNRVLALHIGIDADIKDWEMRSKITYSRNYGTFTTSKYGKSTGIKRAQPSDILFKPVNQLSFYTEGFKSLNEKYDIGFSGAFDLGQLLKHSFGLSLKIKRNI